MLSIGPALRARRYYKVPAAGKKLGWGRSESYRAVERGEIPVERKGKLILVPKRPWDRIVRNLLKAR